MKRNRTLQKLNEGETVYGCFLTAASPDLAETVALQGLDFVVMDWQHGEWTDGTVSAALGRLIECDTTPLVRVRSHDPGLINWVLDMGALGVVVPMVSNAEEASAVVKPAFYPPRGARSAGGARLSRMANGDMSAYLEAANDEILIVPMVETEAAIRNVEEIMRVDGVGAVLVGPGDLMIDVKANGHGEAEHEVLIQRVCEASKRTGVPASPVCTSTEAARKRAAEGFRFVLTGSDRAMMIAATQAFLTAVRGES